MNKYNDDLAEPGFKTVTKRSNPVSQQDVANLAGVSKQTVSRVSNGLTNVEEATREKVLAAMSQLGYRPNSAARALRSGRFHNIGVIMFNLSEYGNVKTLDAVASAATAAGYAITLMPVASATEKEVTGAFNRLSEQAVDGIVILIEAHMLDASDVHLPPGVPVVIVDSNADSTYTVVDADQELGARQATEHLLALGHTSVFHVAGPKESFSAGHRADSWRRTLQEHGAEVAEPLYGDWSVESGYRAGLQLAPLNEITAVFCANDQMALGVLRAMHEFGRKVPESISVVGFDDTPDGAGYWPPLTTIRQDFSELGKQTLAALLHLIGGAKPGGRTIIPTQLVERSSTGPVPRP